MLSFSVELVRRCCVLFSTLPLRFLSERLRIHALESLNAHMITTAPIPEGQLFFLTPTELLRHRANTVTGKEPDMIQWLESLERKSVLWDIGANVGVFSLFAAARRRCKVCAFEPMAANYYPLIRNIQLNRLENFVSAYCVAFAEKTELGVLNLSSAEMGAALNQFGKLGQNSRFSESFNIGSAHGMLGYAIDDFVAQFAPPLPNYIKIDVDGLELSILRGAHHLLRNPVLRAIMVELSITHQEERREAIAMLDTAGFQLLSYGAPQGIDNEYCANYLFTRVAR